VAATAEDVARRSAAARFAASRRPSSAATLEPESGSTATTTATPTTRVTTGARLAVTLAGIQLLIALTGLMDVTIVMVVVVAYSIGLIIAGFKHPRVALYGVLAIAIFFEPFNQDPLMSAGTFFNNDIQGAFHLPGVQLTLLEVIQLLTLASVLFGNRSRGQKLRGGTLMRPAMLFLFMLVFGVVRGMIGGGLFNYAVWEMRFLYSLVVCFVIAANTIRTRADVQEMLSVFFVLSAMAGLEGAYRRNVFIEAGLLGDAQEVWYSHEDVIFWATFMLLVIAQAAFGAPRWQRLLGPFLALLTGYTLLVSERRAGIFSLIIPFLVLTVVLFMANRKVFFMISVPLLICGAIYVPVFWNASGPLAQPARAIRSINDPDPRDAQSNMSRILELIDIRATVASDPLTGVGFGRPYLLVVAIPDISFFPLWNYVTHHNILWIWLKTGMAGFIIFWCLLGSGLSRGAYYVRRLREPELRTFATLAVLGITSSVVYLYVDLGLNGSRIPILLGILLGGVSVLGQIQSSTASRSGVRA
jgi:hypothetical protein